VLLLMHAARRVVGLAACFQHRFAANRSTDFYSGNSPCACGDELAAQVGLARNSSARCRFAANR